MNKVISKLLLELLQDLENTQTYIHGYGYCRTIRNILVGNKNAVIASNFKNKKYYGIFNYLSLKDTEKLLNKLVERNMITCIFTEHGKMYCTYSYLI